MKLILFLILNTAMADYVMQDPLTAPFPQRSTAQITAINPPTPGFFAYDTVTNLLMQWNGTSWAPVSDLDSSAATSTDNALVRWDGASGKLIKDSTVTLTDGGVMSTAGSYQTTAVTGDKFCVWPGYCMGVSASATTFVNGGGTYDFDWFANGNTTRTLQMRLNSTGLSVPVGVLPFVSNGTDNVASIIMSTTNRAVNVRGPLLLWRFGTHNPAWMTTVYDDTNGDGNAHFEFISAAGGYSNRTNLNMDYNTAWFNNTVSATAFTTRSDVSLKQNIVASTLTDAVFNQLSPKQYTWIARDLPTAVADTRTHYGFIAQEVEAVIPSAVYTGKDGLKSIDYAEIVSAAILKLQQLKGKLATGVDDAIIKGGTTGGYENSGVLISDTNDVSGIKNLHVMGTNTNTPGTTTAAVTFMTGRTGNGSFAANQTNGDIALEYGGGGFKHYISHNHNSVANSTGNSINFWLNNSTTSTGSAGAGGGNLRGMSITPIGTGILTATPYQELDVLGDIVTSFHGNASQHNAAEVGNRRIGHISGNNAEFAGMQITTKTLESDGVTARANNADISWWTWGNTIGASTERMRLTERGRLGIGTGNPTDPLTVNGSVVLNGVRPGVSPVNAALQNKGFGYVSIVGANANAQGPHLLFNDNGDIYPQRQLLNWAHDSVWDCFDCFYDGNWRNSTTSSAFRIGKTASNLTIASVAAPTANGTEAFVDRLSINENGNVAIGNFQTPLDSLHIWHRGNNFGGLTVTNDGGGGAQSGIQLMTEFVNSTYIYGAQNRGWHIVARANNYATASEQNDLLFAANDHGAWRNSVLADFATGMWNFFAGTKGAIKVTKVLDYVAGGLPKSGDYVTRGGDLRIDVSGSCVYNSQPTMTHINVDIDDDTANGIQWVFLGDLKVWANGRNSHETMNPRTFIRTGIPAGKTVRVQLSDGGNCTTDGNDFFDVTVTEY